MKLKYILGGFIIVCLVVVIVKSMPKSDYADFASAKETGKTVQILGSVIKSNKYIYKPEQNNMIFEMKDEKNNIALVNYSGIYPNNFDIAPMVVIKGKFVGNTFKASDILTKCPSKYEGSVDKSK